MAMLKLVGLEGPLRGKSRMLSEGEYMMGRDGCAISIPDPKVSSIHAKLNVTNSHITIEDVDSLNGTYVNDPQKANRIFFETLHDQDTFALGPNTVFGIRFIEFQAVGFWKRVLAVLVDYLVLAPVIFVGALLIGFSVGMLYLGRAEATLEDRELAIVVARILGWFWGTIVTFLYFTIMHGWKGQTLGKMALGIRVVRSDGSKVSYGTAFLRHLMWVLLAQLSLGIFYIFLAVHPQKRGWHDLIADTRVIEAEKN
jgi:uncharacterized RDD family membrane protein YckC